MAEWEVLCFHNERGRDVFCLEYQQQMVRAKAKFRTTIETLRDQPRDRWTRENGFDLLTGKKYRQYRGLGKLRIQVPGAAHRPLGFFGPRPGTFTLLIWATERDGEFSPPNVL